MDDYFWHVAPTTSMPYIKNKGIYTPRKVKQLVDTGELPDSVLGVSYGENGGATYFPDHVSLLRSSTELKGVAELLTYNRTGQYKSHEIFAHAYVVKPQIANLRGFLDEQQTRELHPESFETEVLFQGDIPFELLEFPSFNVPTID